MFRIDVRMDLKRFERELDDLARRQLPFAIARALTWTAREARDEVRRQKLISLVSLCLTEALGYCWK